MVPRNGWDEKCSVSNSITANFCGLITSTKKLGESSFNLYSASLQYIISTDEWGLGQPDTDSKGYAGYNS